MKKFGFRCQQEVKEIKKIVEKPKATLKIANAFSNMVNKIKNQNLPTMEEELTEVVPIETSSRIALRIHRAQRPPIRAHFGHAQENDLS